MCCKLKERKRKIEREREKKKRKRERERDRERGRAQLSQHSKAQTEPLRHTHTHTLSHSVTSSHRQTHTQTDTRLNPGSLETARCFVAMVAKHSQQSKAGAETGEGEPEYFSNYRQPCRAVRSLLGGLSAESQAVRTTF